MISHKNLDFSEGMLEQWELWGLHESYYLTKSGLCPLWQIWSSLSQSHPWTPGPLASEAGAYEKGSHSSGPTYCSFRISAVNTKESEFYFIFWLFRTAPEVYGSSQARGRIGAAAAGLHHSSRDPSCICNLYHSSRQCRMDTSQVLDPLSHNGNSLPVFLSSTIFNWIIITITITATLATASRL